MAAAVDCGSRLDDTGGIQIMSYNTFLSLIRLQSSMRRSLHVGAGREKRLRKKGIESITDRLRGLSCYRDYLHRMLESGVELG